MNKRLIILPVFLLFAENAHADKYVAGPYEAELLEVIDGDTIRVQATIWVNTFKIATIRVNGIDTPELKGACDQA